MKIITFGTIRGRKDGSLLFSNFHIDCEDSNLGGVVCLLRAIIERLQIELTDAEMRFISNKICKFAK